MSCLGLEYFCFEGDGLWTAPDADLIALAKTEIAQDRPDRRGRRRRRLRGAPAQGLSGLRRRLSRQHGDDPARPRDAAIRRLHLVGRNGMHKYNNQDHAMMTAMLTARNILAGERIYDVWNVNEDAEYHEAGASGAQGSAGERAPGAAQGGAAGGLTDVPATGTPIRPREHARGFKLRPGYLDRSAQEALAAAVSERHRTGAAVHAAHAQVRPAVQRAHDQLRAARLGFGPDAATAISQHHPVTGEPWPPMPEIVLAAWAELAGYPHPPEACLINVYGPDARMGLHQDRDEQRLRGAGGIAFAGPDLHVPARRTRARRSDPVVPARFRRCAGARRRCTPCFSWRRQNYSRHIHAAADGSRINLTLRRVNGPA